MEFLFSIAEWIIIYWNPILFFIFVNYGSFILQHTISAIIGREANEVVLEPDTVGTILWIILISVYHVIQSKNSCHLDIFAPAISALFILIFALNIQHTISFTQSILFSIQTEYFRSLIFSLFLSAFVFKQYSSYSALKIQHSWFNNNYKHTSNNNNIIHLFTKYYLKWIMYLLFNIIAYFHCYGFQQKCDTVSREVTLQIVMTIFISMPYYEIYFKSNNIPYDLYFNKLQMMSISLSFNIIQTYCAFYAFFVREYVNDTAHTVFGSLLMFNFLSSLVIYPKIFKFMNQQKFKRIIANKNALTDTWWDYVSLNQNNFNRFQVFLAQNNLFHNLLFVTEIMMYKYIMLDKMKRIDGTNMDNGYLLQPFDHHRMNSLSIASSRILDKAKNLNVEDINTTTIKADICELYAKYMFVTHGDQKMENPLYETFTSIMKKKSIAKRLEEINDETEIEILNVFDKVVENDCNILQSLYTQYVLLYKS